ncbi:hypothetical protein ACHQM5_011097 [Ranunculus cassubicifolius]
MAEIMMKKFKKYWSECSLVLAVAYVLNPGCKMKFVDNYYTEIYGKAKSETYTSNVVNALYTIYAEYVPVSNSVHTMQQPSTSHDSGGVVSENIVSMKAKRMACWYQREGIGNSETKSELDLYLDESLSPLKELSILDWWKINSPKYPTLSKMARDILCIPVSSVPSEAAFSSGGRVVSDSRASLSHNSIEALVYGESWLPDLFSPSVLVEDFSKLGVADIDIDLEDDNESATQEVHTIYSDEDIE